MGDAAAGICQGGFIQSAGNVDASVSLARLVRVACDFRSEQPTIRVENDSVPSHFQSLYKRSRLTVVSIGNTCTPSLRGILFTSAGHGRHGGTEGKVRSLMVFVPP